MADQPRRHTVSAFESREHADRALADLRKAGFEDQQIGWASRHDETPEGTQDVASGAAAGAVTGGVLGGLGAAAAMALIPGVGPFIAGGALATILVTGGASAAAGGLLGGLMGLGATEEESKFYDDEFKAGRPIMTVDAGDRHQEASDIFRRSGGYDYDSRRTNSGQTTTAPTMTRMPDAAAATDTLELDKDEAQNLNRPGATRSGEANYRVETNRTDR